MYHEFFIIFPFYISYNIIIHRIIMIFLVLHENCKMKCYNHIKKLRHM